MFSGYIIYLTGSSSYFHLFSGYVVITDKLWWTPWWLNTTPPETIGSSVGMMTFPSEWTNNTCSKPPTRRAYMNFICFGGLRIEMKSHEINNPSGIYTYIYIYMCAHKGVYIYIYVYIIPCIYIYIYITYICHKYIHIDQAWDLTVVPVVSSEDRGCSGSVFPGTRSAPWIVRRTCDAQVTGPGQLHGWTIAQHQHLYDMMWYDVCIYIYRELYMYMYMYICICIYVYMYICICIYRVMCMYIYIYIHVWNISIYFILFQYLWKKQYQSKWNICQQTMSDCQRVNALNTSENVWKHT